MPPPMRKQVHTHAEVEHPVFGKSCKAQRNPQNWHGQHNIYEASCAACWEEVPRQKSCTARQTSSRHASTCVACRITHYSNGHSKTGPWVCLPDMADSAHLPGTAHVSLSKPQHRHVSSTGSMPWACVPSHCPECAIIAPAGTPIVVLHFCHTRSISGLVVEYIVAIDVTRVRFAADACYSGKVRGGV